MRTAAFIVFIFLAQMACSQTIQLRIILDENATMILERAVPVKSRPIRHGKSGDYCVSLEGPDGAGFFGEDCFDPAFIRRGGKNPFFEALSMMWAGRKPGYELLDDDWELYALKVYRVSEFEYTNYSSALLSLRIGGRLTQQETVSFCIVDGVCRGYESYLTCPADCPQPEEDKHIKNPVIQETTIKPKDMPFSRFSSQTHRLAAAAAVVLAGIASYFIRLFQMYRRKRTPAVGAMIGQAYALTGLIYMFLLFSPMRIFPDSLFFASLTIAFLPIAYSLLFFDMHIISEFTADFMYPILFFLICCFTVSLWTVLGAFSAVSAEWMHKKWTLMVYRSKIRRFGGGPL